LGPGLCGGSGWSVEVTLHEERAISSKETVPVERVRMDTETVTGGEQVSEEVRKEQIETEGVDVRGEKSKNQGESRR